MGHHTAASGGSCHGCHQSETNLCCCNRADMQNDVCFFTMTEYVCFLRQNDLEAERSMLCIREQYSLSVDPQAGQALLLLPSWLGCRDL